MRRQIIRRRLYSGTCIGNYMIVTNIRNGNVYGRYVGRKEQFFIAKQSIIEKNFVHLHTAYIQIRRPILNNLLKANPVQYTHEASKQWLDASNKVVDILVLWDMAGRRLYYLNPVFKRIIVKKTIAIARDSRERDITICQPSVRVYLNRIGYEECQI